jgi:Flp pilus assembly protein TadG
MKDNSSQTGSASVEFALVLPVIALLCCAVIDFGQAVNLSTELRNAARAGAQYARAHPADTDGIEWATQNAIKEASTSFTVTLVTSSDGAGNTLPYYCTCSDGDPTGTNQINCNTATCASGTKNFYVSVTTSETYSPLIPYPGLPSSIPVIGTAIMQVQ